LIIQRIRNQVLPRRLVATYDDWNYYPLDTLNIMNSEEQTNYSLCYILAIAQKSPC
jgi:hypothetical protein